MFEPSAKPRVYGLAPGQDFPKALVAGLRMRLAGSPPEAMALVTVIVNTRRMARRLRNIFDAGPPGFLPRIRLLTDLQSLLPPTDMPPPASPLRRRLELIKLIAALLDQNPDLAPRASLYDLSDSLAALMDEMQGEGVSPDTIAALDVAGHSAHWARSQAFMKIAQAYLQQTDVAPDAEARQRQLVLNLADHWQIAPPKDPVILAGSTGSRGTTSLLMQAVAHLPQGALVLPGFDFDLPAHVWASLSDALLSEDHPQYRFHRLLQQMNISSHAVQSWANEIATSTPRTRLISLSLRPAPVTDAWLNEGPKLQGLAEASAGMTLIEAPSPRIEALAIAMQLRKAVSENKAAALITPDRMLTRQVTAALDRWDILPDDSAGMPLHLSPPGRFLRHVGAVLQRKLDAESLLTLLRHPLTNSGAGRGSHGLFTQQFEAQMRKTGLPYPEVSSVIVVAEKAAKRMKEPSPFLEWAEWVAQTFCGRQEDGEKALSDWVTTHLELAERISAGPPRSDSFELWQKGAGQKAKEVMDELAAQAKHGGIMKSGDYVDLVAALLRGAEVRDRDAPHPNVMIWGTLEARVQGADLVILGGLNEGTWPEAPAPDPWLNRQMRLATGLLLPERRIGLSAHDYQQAISAPEVVLTRAIRSEDAETVPSRWLSRLGNLLQGLPQAEGRESWQKMRARGQYWIDQTVALETVKDTPRARRPSPKPPVGARPRSLSVTEIKRLIRDPYAVYAKHVLGLRPIDPLVPSPDAPVRGIVVHEIMERFIKSVIDNPALLTREHLMAMTDDVLAAEVPWPAARLMWRARIERAADWFVEREQQRQKNAVPIAFERAAKGEHVLSDLGVTITGYADRIDRSADGSVQIYDYKTGAPPSAKEQKFFDKQLLIEAAMLEEGSFKDVGAAPVSSATFIGLGTTLKEVPAPLNEEPPAAVLEGLKALIGSYLCEAQGFTSRRLIKTEDSVGDYDQLARFGEWTDADSPDPEVLK